LPSFLKEHRPITGGLDNFDLQTISNQEEPSSPTGSGLERQNTVVVASLLKSRQRKQGDRLLPALTHSASIISHIERSGSITPATTSFPTAGHEVKGVREPYGRRYRRMKAERDLEAQPSNAFQGTRMES